MSLIFSDVSASFINMAQPEFPAAVTAIPENVGAQKQVFADKLEETLRSVESHHASAQKSLQASQQDSLPKDIPVEQAKILAPEEDRVETISGKLDDIINKSSEEKNENGLILALKKKISTLDGKVPENMLEILDDEDGAGFIMALRNMFLMLSKGNLKDISIDAEGLGTLKKILLKAGFEENEIDDLMSQLSGKLDEGTLELDAVFEQLFELSFEPETVSTKETMLDAEDATFLESILVSLGIPQKTVQEILSEADRGTNGISLDLVIEKLQTIQKKSFLSQQSYQVDKADTNIQMLAGQMGLELENTTSGSFSLNDVMKSLESLRQDKKEQQSLISDSTHHGQKDMGDEKSVDLLNTLFKALKIKNDGSEKQTPVFSMDKIKETFETPLMGQAESEVGTKSLFDPDKGKKTVKNAGMKDAFKEIQALVDQKEKQTSATKDLLTDAKDGGRKLTSFGEKNIDQSQAGISDLKSSEAGQKIELLKTRVPAKPLPAYVTQQVQKSLVRAINQGESSLKIQLKPAELGRLLVTIDTTRNGMQVSIMTENNAAKDIITQSITEIKTVFSNSGLNLERFEVDMSSDFRQSMADAQQQSGQSGKRGQKQNDKTSDVALDKGLDGGINELSGQDQSGSVHLVA